MQNYRLNRSERLRNKKWIAELFTEGKAVISFPIKIVYIIKSQTGQAPVQFAFSVPKRSFRKAFQRNFLKRRIKEAFRLNKNELYAYIEQNDYKQIVGMIIYIGKETTDFNTINKAMQKGLYKLKRHNLS